MTNRAAVAQMTLLLVAAAGSSAIIGRYMYEFYLAMYDCLLHARNTIIRRWKIHDNAETARFEQIKECAGIAMAALDFPEFGGTFSYHYVSVTMPLISKTYPIVHRSIAYFLQHVSNSRYDECIRFLFRGIPSFFYLRSARALFSFWCTGRVFRSGRCRACVALLSTSRTLRQRIKRRQAGPLASFAFVRADYISAHEKHFHHQRQHTKHTRRTAYIRQKRDYVRLKRNLKKAIRNNNFKGIQDSVKGYPPDIIHQAVLEPLAKEAAKFAATRRLGSGRRYFSSKEHDFYATVMSFGGPRLHAFISRNIGGPSTRTTRRHLSAVAFTLTHGVDERNVQHVAEKLRSLDLADVPCALSEDGTALKCSIQVTKEGDEYVLYGLTGGPVVVNQVADIKTLHESRTLATTLYVHELVPLINGAPHFPIAMYFTDNRFTLQQVARDWGKLHSLCSKFGINIVLHAGDGDSRFRGAALNAMLPHHGLSTLVRFPDSMVQLSIQNRETQDASTQERQLHHYCAIMDPLHIAWRLRVQYCTGGKMLIIFGNPASSVNLQRSRCAHAQNLRASDLSQRDKQNWSGTKRLFCINSDGEPDRRLLRSMDSDSCLAGDFLYLSMCNYFVRIFTSKETITPSKTVFYAYSVLLLMSAAKTYIKKSPNLTLKRNFLSNQTYLDVIITCNVYLLLVILFRDTMPNSPFCPGRFSSRYNEYLFSYCRLKLRGNNKFTALGATRLLKHYDLQQRIEFKQQLKFPDSKRSMRRDEGGGRTCCQTEYPSDEDIQRIIRHSRDHIRSLLVNIGIKLEDYETSSPIPHATLSKYAKDVDEISASAPTKRPASVSKAQIESSKLKFMRVIEQFISNSYENSNSEGHGVAERHTVNPRFQQMLEMCNRYNSSISKQSSDRDRRFNSQEALHELPQAVEPGEEYDRHSSTMLNVFDYVAFVLEREVGYGKVIKIVRSVGYKSSTQITLLCGDLNDMSIRCHLRRLQFNSNAEVTPSGLGADDPQCSRSADGSGCASDDGVTSFRTLVPVAVSTEQGIGAFVQRHISGIVGKLDARVSVDDSGNELVTLLNEEILRCDEHFEETLHKYTSFCEHHPQQAKRDVLRKPGQSSSHHGSKGSAFRKSHAKDFDDSIAAAVQAKHLIPTGRTRSRIVYSDANNIEDRVPRRPRAQCRNPSSRQQRSVPRAEPPMTRSRAAESTQRSSTPIAARAPESSQSQHTLDSSSGASDRSSESDSERDSEDSVAVASNVVVSGFHTATTKSKRKVITPLEHYIGAANANVADDMIVAIESSNSEDIGASCDFASEESEFEPSCSEVDSTSDSEADDESN